MKLPCQAASDDIAPDPVQMFLSGLTMTLFLILASIKKSADLLNSFQDILHSMYINLGEISVGEVKSRLSGIPAWHWMERAVSWLGLSHLWFIVVADLEISDREDGILRGVYGYCYIKGEISVDLGESTTDVSVLVYFL